MSKAVTIVFTGHIIVDDGAIELVSQDGHDAASLARLLKPYESVWYPPVKGKALSIDGSYQGPVVEIKVTVPSTIHDPDTMKEILERTGRTAVQE